MFKRLATAAIVAAPVLSFAAVDVSGITDSITDISAVGVAVFSVMVGIKLTKWIRRAL